MDDGGIESINLSITIIRKKQPTAFVKQADALSHAGKRRFELLVAPLQSRLRGGELDVSLNAGDELGGGHEVGDTIHRTGGKPGNLGLLVLRRDQDNHRDITRYDVFLETPAVFETVPLRRQSVEQDKLR